MQQNLDRDLLIVLHDVARTMRTRFDQKARASHAMTRAQWIEAMSTRITAGLDAATRETLIDALLVIKENLANEALTDHPLAAAGE